MILLNICGKVGRATTVKHHVEANHITGVNHSCEICGKISRTRNAARHHKRDNHISEYCK